MMQYIIHIGYSKTGTTAVQNFLAHNRSVLAEKGILYPDIRYQGVSLGVQDHNLLAWTITGKQPWFRMPPTDYVKQIERQVERNSSIHTVLLSGEFFVDEPSRWRFSSAADYLEAQRQKIADLRHLFDNCEVRILVYLRRQDHWVNSSINQFIKNTGLEEQRVFHSVDDYLQLISPRLDYRAVLAMWVDEFGKDNIVVAPYEKVQFKNGNLYDDFLDKIGIPSSDGFDRPPVTAETENISLSRDVLEVKRILNKVPKKKSEERMIIKALKEISHEIRDDNPLWKHFLGPRERAELLDRYEDGNKSIAASYLGRRDGLLFLEPWPDPDEQWETYTGLSVEKAIEILFRLQRKLNSMPYRWDRLCSAPGRWLRQHALWLHALLRPLYRLFFR